MKILFQVNRKLKRISYGVLILLLGGVVLITFFALLLRAANQPNPLRASCDVFFGMLAQEEINVHGLIIAEIATRELYIILFGGIILAQVLKPVNPIIASKYIEYNAPIMRFRYWILYSSREFLYNIKIRAIVVNENDLTSGSLSPFSNPELEITQEQLDAARGVRYAEVCLSDEKRDKLTTLMTDNSNIIYFLIQGTDEGGNSHNIAQIYNSESIMCGCRFVSIRATQFQNNDHEYFRYHYFDKLTSNNVAKAKRCHTYARNDILDRRELLRRRYKGSLESILLDFFSSVASHWLNR